MLIRDNTTLPAVGASSLTHIPSLSFLRLSKKICAMQDIQALLKTVPRDVESPASRLAVVFEKTLVSEGSARNRDVLMRAFHRLIQATKQDAWKQGSSSLTPDQFDTVISSYEEFAALVLTELASSVQATAATTNAPTAEAIQVDSPIQFTNPTYFFGDSASAKLGSSSSTSTSSADMPRSVSHVVSAEKPQQLRRRLSRTTSQCRSFSNVPVNHLDATVGPNDFAQAAAARPSSTDTCGSMTPVVVTDSALKDEDGMLQVNQFTFFGLIGKGAQGEVYLATDTKKNRNVAVKVVPRPSYLRLQGSPSVALRNRLRKVDRGELLRREILIMKQCRHRNIVALHEVIDDAQHDEIYLVMQYARLGPVIALDQAGKSMCKPLAADVVLNYGRQLCAGLQYLHRHCIVHCDIKPENILLDESGTPLLCDFGVSKLFADGSSSHPVGGVGTKVFKPPEYWNPPARSTTKEERNTSPMSDGSDDGQSRENPEDKQQVLDRAADVWALGLSLYAMLFGHLPFALDGQIGDVLNVQITLPRDQGSPTPTMEQLVPVLQHMLALAPEDRWTAQEAYDALSVQKPIPVGSRQGACTPPAFEVEPAGGRHVLPSEEDNLADGEGLTRIQSIRVVRNSLSR